MEPAQPLLATSFQLATIDTSTLDPDRATLRLAVSGELDVASAPLLERHLDGMIRADVHVELDISAVTFIDCRGLAVLVQRSRPPTRGAGGLTVSHTGLSGQVRRLIEVTGTSRDLWPLIGLG
jgi:anti-anti-sigma factor